MTVERIRTDPDPSEPFLLSQGVRAGRLLFVSGQAGYDDAGRIVAGGFAAQGEQAFANLGRVVRAGGATLADVVKVATFVTDMAQFEAVVALRRRHFRPPYPADTLVEVSRLYTPEAMVEIEAVAVVRGHGCAKTGRANMPVAGPDAAARLDPDPSLGRPLPPCRRRFSRRRRRAGTITPQGQT